MYSYIDILIIAFFIVVGIVGKLLGKSKPDNEKKNIKFDEFDDIEEIKKQEMKEKKEMQYETQVLKKVYSDEYNRSIKESYEKNYNNNNFYNNRRDSIFVFDQIKANNSAIDAIGKAKKDLQDFKIMDSVYHNNDNVAEGNQINALRENGNNFEIDLFKNWSMQIFRCIKSKENDVLAIVKNFMTEELYNKLEYQKKQFAKDGLEFITEDLRIQKCILYDYSRSMSKEELKVRINATMKEYIIKKTDNTVVRGDRNESINKNIIMTFVKRNVEDYEGLLHNCPNCGAEVSQTELGKCKYCNTLIFPIRYNWTLTKFETI